MATIKDVAKAAGVSVATVSRVLNKSPKASEASKEAVTNAMKMLGYRPNAAAQALVSQTTNTLGVLVSDVSDPFFGQLIKAVDNVAHKYGKHLLVGNGYHDASEERRAIELLINSRCQALVLHAKGLPDDELINYANEVPGLVLINRYIPQIAQRCIYLDNHVGAFLATEHLIKQGHTQIACLASTEKIDDTQARIAGYQAALAKYKISLASDYIEYGSADSQGGEAAMSTLLNKAIPITALVCYNDYMAAGAQAIARASGVAMPRSLSIIGFDDGLIAKYLVPSLTTIHYPIELMAKQAGLLALSLAKGNDLLQSSCLFKPTLVQRDSVTRCQTP